MAITRPDTEPGLELREDVPDWSAVQKSRTRQRPAVEIARRAAIAVPVAVLMWLAGARVPAAVLLGLVVIATAAAARLPRVARGLERGERALQRAAGRALTLFVLALFELFIYTPAWLLLRAIGRNPLAMGLRPDAPSFWRAAQPPGKALHRRTFSNERIPSAATGGRSIDGLPFPRLRAALGLLVILLALDIGVNFVINHFKGHASGAPLPAIPAAGAHEPWARDLAGEVGAAFGSATYDPYLAWRVLQFNGRYIHVANGARRSYEPPGSSAPNAITIDFFGGSAMFGVFQRDERTIASDFARLAQAHGIRVRVANYGQPAYVNWQEMLLFESLLGSAPKPNLVVFYDGFNDLLTQFDLGAHAQPSQLEAAIVANTLRQGSVVGSGWDLTAPLYASPSVAKSLYDTWADHSAIYGLGHTLGLLPTRPAPRGQADPRPTAQQLRPDTIGVDAASLISRGDEIVKRLAAGYGIPSAFFWQPSIYSKRVVAGEQSGLRNFQNAQAWIRATAVARSHLDPSVIDLGSVLNDVNSPVMYDSVHTNELGALVVARAMYARLAPALRRLAREKGQ